MLASAKSYTSYHHNRDLVHVITSVNVAQFNSKTVFKDGDPVSLQLFFPVAIPTCEQIQQVCIHIYKTTQVHRTTTGKHNLHFHTKTYP